MSTGDILDQDTVDIYQEVMTDLVNDFSRIITIVLPDQVEDCPNCNKGREYVSWASGITFGYGQPCPYCHGDGKLHTQRSTTCNAIISKEIKEFVKQDGVIDYKNVTTVKTFLEYYDDFIAAQVVIIDGQNHKMVSKPIKIGLRDLFLVKVHLELI